ncbi:MAG TPA: trypsin-like serine protease [Polyangiaceae bacterium]|jgi:V8-like Glu-specific endopeptidase|nr:trypsin-like serine protease [Polyangiaceae bacterium]
MTRWLGSALCGCVALASCGPAAAPGTLTGEVQSAIEDGTVDTTHTFAVGIVQLSMEQSGDVAFCSGVLLAPNLVATARHCVSNLSSAAISCGTSMFGSVVSASEVLVTTDTTISPNGNLIDVSTIVIPSGANEKGVCGDDLALLILAKNITLPQYVTPVISPPMTDTMYSTSVTAIGYGVTTPTDQTGTTAGERRIKENVKLYCIPNDPNYADCFSDPIAMQVLSANEFISGDASTCEGDSGSGAYDQAAFDRGEWLAFGVLSRGATSQDGDTCIEPIYTRFDAWGSLLMSTAQQAAAAGHYTAPAWALDADAAAGSATGEVDAAAASATGASGGTTTTTRTGQTGQTGQAGGGSGAGTQSATSGGGASAAGTSSGSGASDAPAKGASNAGCSAAATPLRPHDAASGFALAALGLLMGRVRRKRRTG